ncbi:hypothetical protein KP509_39G047900 [Ceratopteris richardii]|uniref:Uncharacterized protein n=1 Tax=Ceratopteris richardii TaxID=49495 RepID=A0A8T2Q109_CERRI|nr:hypothetical protein KP509_39G047900 [Ceratopteris richardii]
MAKSRARREGPVSGSSSIAEESLSPSVGAAQGVSSPSPPVPNLDQIVLPISTPRERDEDLQGLKSAVQLLAEQQAVQARCVDLLMRKLKEGTQLKNDEEKDADFPLHKDPPIRQQRSRAVENEELISNDPPPYPSDASLFDGSEMKKERANKTPGDLQSSIAWKWRWAVEAKKAKELSNRIAELSRNQGKLHTNAAAWKINHSKTNSQRKDRNGAVEGPKRVAPLNLEALQPSASAPSPTCMPSPSIQPTENGDPVVYRTGSKIDDLQKQVSRLTGCLNKMMPTLVFLVNRAGSQKLINHCFAQWKALSSMNRNELHSERASSTRSLKPCSRVLKGLSIVTDKAPILPRQRFRRGPNIPEAMTESFSHTPYPSSRSATTKALHTLQVALTQELGELQAIMASEMEKLKQRVEAMSPPQSLRWQHDLLSLWEVSTNVAELLQRARTKFALSGEPPAFTQRRGGNYLPMPRRNRHRNACHPIVSITSSELLTRSTTRPTSTAPIIRITTPEPSSRTVIRPSSTTPIIKITTPEPKQRAKPSPPIASITGSGGTIVRLSPTGPNGCQVRITPRRLATHLQAQEQWHGRHCLAAKHAASLQRQIERLKARHRSVSARLRYHEQQHPLMPQKTILTLTQNPSVTIQESSSKAT